VIKALNFWLEKPSHNVGLLLQIESVDGTETLAPHDLGLVGNESAKQGIPFLTHFSLFLTVFLSLYVILFYKQCCTTFVLLVQPEAYMYNTNRINN
jgi:hypothetical protein